MPHLLKSCSREVAPFDSDVAEEPFLVGLLQDVLLHGLLADQSVNVHVPRLADTMAAILSLCVHRRIPVGIVENDRVGAGQIDAHTTRSRGQDETEDSPVGIEAFH